MKSTLKYDPIKQKFISDTPFLTRMELCRIFKCNATTIDRRTKSGQLKRVILNGFIKYHIADINLIDYVEVTE